MSEMDAGGTRRRDRSAAEGPAAGGGAETVASAGPSAGGGAETMASTPLPVPAPGDGSPLSPVVEAPSEDVDTASDSSPLPGEHRGGFTRALTEPVPTAEPVQPQPELQWAPTPAPLPRSAPWALTFAVIGLVVSLIVGWGFALGLVAVVLAIIALRRPWESRGVAVWALCLAVLSLVYSAGWLWWAWTRVPIVG